MKKLTSLIIFVGLAINVNGQEEPKNLKEAMDGVKNHWMMGNWERKSSDGTTTVQVSFKWAVKDGVVSVQVSRDGEIFNQGIIGFDSISGKVIGKSMSRRGVSDSEWVVVEGKLFEVVKGKWKNQEGEINQYSFARSHRKVDENTMEVTTHKVDDAGEVGEVVERDGVKRIRKYNRKKPSTTDKDN